MLCRYGRDNKRLRQGFKLGSEERYDWELDMAHEVILETRY